MQISIVTDAKGNVVGFSRPSTNAEAASRGASSRAKKSTAKSAVVLAANDGQPVSEVELSAELASHYGKETFADEIFRHVLVRKGATVSLERAKG